MPEWNQLNLIILFHYVEDVYDNFFELLNPRLDKQEKSCPEGQIMRYAHNQ